MKPRPIYNDFSESELVGHASRGTTSVRGDAHLRGGANLRGGSPLSRGAPLSGGAPLGAHAGPESDRFPIF